MEKQLSLFGELRHRKAHFVVFHDESESRPNRGWLLIGLTFVLKQDVPKVHEALRWHRDREQYFGEIHFSELPKLFKGKYGGDARVARGWLRSYGEGLAQVARCTVLAVDRSCPTYEHNRFSRDFHAYNRFTAMALKSGIAWFLSSGAWDSVELELISDAKSRKSRPDEGFEDNFERYIPKRAGLDNLVSRVVEGKSRPEVSVKQVRLADSAGEDLLQLTDLLLGASKVAVAGGTKQETKTALGAMVAAWHEDNQRPPWRQRYKLFREFSLWGFPDERGWAYNNVPLHATAELSVGLFDG